MKNAPDQSAPVGLKSIKFRSLPDRHILLYFFKYIHFLSTSFPTRSDMTGFNVKYLSANFVVFDSRGIRQMDIPARPLGSLLAEIKKEHPDFYPKLNKSKCSLQGIPVMIFRFCFLSGSIFFCDPLFIGSQFFKNTRPRLLLNLFRIRFPDLWLLKGFLHFFNN